jgi:rubrerythrin
MRLNVLNPKYQRELKLSGKKIPWVMNGLSFRPNVMQSPYHGLQESLQIIREFVAGERNAESFYQRLLELAPSEEDRILISSIREVEREHIQIFREIYLAFTGREVTATVPITVYKEPKSYEDGLKQAIFNKWKTGQRGGTILAAMPTGYYQNLLAKIAIDNVTLVSKLNY